MYASSGLCRAGPGGALYCCVRISREETGTVGGEQIIFNSSSTTFQLSATHSLLIVVNMKELLCLAVLALTSAINGQECEYG